MDTISKQYAAAVRQDRWTICGRLLLPLQIGHVLTLQAIGNPFAELQQAASGGLGDLVEAVWICSRPQNADNLRSRVTAVRVALAGAWWRKKAWMLQRARMCAYMIHAWSGPRVWENVKPDAAPNDSPELQSLVLHRMTHLHQSLDDALSTPLKLAFHDLAGWLAAHDGCRLFTDRDQKLLDLAKSEATEVTPA